VPGTNGIWNLRGDQEILNQLNVDRRHRIIDLLVNSIHRQFIFRNLKLNVHDSRSVRLA